MLHISELVNEARIHHPMFKEHFKQFILNTEDLLSFISLYKKRYKRFNKPVQKAVKKWINECTPFELERGFIATEGQKDWTLRDVFRMFHPVPIGNRQFLYRYIVGKWRIGEPIRLEFKKILRRIENVK